MKTGLFSFVAVFIAMAMVSCGPMTPADYSISQTEQRQVHPKFQTVYRNGQTPEKIRGSIKEAGIKPMLSCETAYRPSNGWAARSWELLHEQANGTTVSRVDRFAFGGISGLAAVVYYHRVFYGKNGRSIGWYVTHD